MKIYTGAMLLVTACGGAIEPKIWVDSPTIVTSVPESEMRQALDAWAVTGVLPTVELIPSDGEGASENGISEVYYGDPGVGTVTGNRRLALTQTWSKHGRYIEADIILDSEEDWSTGEARTGYYDLLSVLTHELGHFWGLVEESKNPEATMYGKTRQGETKKRDLEQEDIERIREIYP